MFAVSSFRNVSRETLVILSEFGVLCLAFLCYPRISLNCYYFVPQIDILLCFILEVRYARRVVQCSIVTLGVFISCQVLFTQIYLVLLVFMIKNDVLAHVSRETFVFLPCFLLLLTLYNTLLCEWLQQLSSQSKIVGKCACAMFILRSLLYFVVITSSDNFFCGIVACTYQLRSFFMVCMFSAIQYHSI